MQPLQLDRRSRLLHLPVAAHALNITLSAKPLAFIRNQVKLIVSKFAPLLCEVKHEKYVFVFEGQPVVQTATKTWRTACASVGLTNFRWHDLRHTWASWHAQDGTPLNVLQELGGWESSEMVRRYAHLSTVHLADYVNRRQALSDVSVTANKKGLSISA